MGEYPRLFRGHGMWKIDYLLGRLALEAVVVNIISLATADWWLLNVFSNLRNQYFGVQRP